MADETLAGLDEGALRKLTGTSELMAKLGQPHPPLKHPQLPPDPPGSRKE